MIISKITIKELRSMTGLSFQDRTVVQAFLELNYCVLGIARLISCLPASISVGIHQVTPYNVDTVYSIQKMGELMILESTNKQLFCLKLVIRNKCLKILLAY